MVVADIFAKRDLVSASIGADLQRRGIYAVAASLAAIALYLGVRFAPRGSTRSSISA